MRDLSLPVRMVLGAYALTRRLGVLETRAGRLMFRGAYFRYKRWFEDPYGALLGRYPHLVRGGHVLDVGANIGYTACLFERYLDPGRRVVAFEPERDNVRMLLESVRAHGLTERVTVVPAAVGEADGSLRLHRNLNHHADHRVLTESLTSELGTTSVVDVPVRSLDAYWAQHGRGEPVAMVKLDVQGYEPRAVEGMTGLLASQPGMSVTMEYAPADIASMGLDESKMWRTLREAGLRPHAITAQRSLEPMVWEALSGTVERGRYGELVLLGREVRLDVGAPLS